MSRRLIALFALIAFALSGLGLPAYASSIVTEPGAVTAPCHEMAQADQARHKAPTPHKDCESLGCHCALSHSPATLTTAPLMSLSEPVAIRTDFAATHFPALEATMPESLKRPPRA